MAGDDGIVGGLKGLGEAAGKALTPAADEFGKEIAPLGKRAGQLTNRVGILLIRALEPLVYGLEKSADWIEEAVTERLKDVPPENVVAPNPRIAVPAMQALTYSLNDELIREMFANLLAADMNIETKRDAHPAFVELIKEMTPADAQVLKICRESRQCSFIVRFGSKSRFLTFGTHYSFAIDGLSDNDISTSLNNLERLGLLERRDEFPATEQNDNIEKDLKAKYEHTRAENDTPEIKKHIGISEDRHVEINIKRSGLYLNPLGVSFARICLK
jgi:Abortive infection alpha